MEGFLAQLFIVLNLFIRVPIRIAMHFKKKDQKLAKIDLWASIITGLFVEAVVLYGYIIGEIELITLVIMSLLFGVFPIWLGWLAVKQSREEKDRWHNLYLQTKQRPEQDDYGFCVENPIWTGTAQFYFDHICTEDGRSVSWKKRKVLKLEQKNGVSVLNGFYACELAKYDVFLHENHIDTFYICTKAGLDNLKIWHAPKGYKFE